MIANFIKYFVRTYYHAILYASPQNIKATQLQQHEAKQVASLQNDEVVSCCYQAEYTSLQLTRPQSKYYYCEIQKHKK